MVKRLHHMQIEMRRCPVMIYIIVLSPECLKGIAVPSTKSWHVTCKMALDNRWSSKLISLHTLTHKRKNVGNYFLMCPIMRGTSHPKTHSHSDQKMRVLLTPSWVNSALVVNKM
jgi:hypothetical protein